MSKCANCNTERERSAKTYTPRMWCVACDNVTPNKTRDSAAGAAEQRPRETLADARYPKERMHHPASRKKRGGLTLGFDTPS